MAMEKFERSESDRVPDPEPASAKVKFLSTSANGMVVVFLAAATRMFGLKPDGRVDLFYDADRKLIGVRKRKNGAFKLVKHGSENRLKVTITDLVEAKGITVEDGFESEATREPDGMIVFPHKRGRGRPRKVASVNGVAH